jgi:hypothetical protein
LRENNKMHEEEVMKQNGSVAKSAAVILLR